MRALSSIPRFSTVLISLFAPALGAAALAGAATAPPNPPQLPPLTGLPSVPLLTGPASPGQPTAQGTPSAQAPAQTAGATSVRAATALERSVVAEINVVRRAHGRSRLSVSAQLQRAGRNHSRDLALAGLFTHSWSDGTSFGRWIRSFYPINGARSWSAAENLAWSAPGVTAQQAVEMWLESPEHHRILLDRRWRQVGLGVVAADSAPGVYGGQNIVVLAAEFGVRR